MSHQLNMLDLLDGKQGQPARPILLLDLNFTLVANSKDKDAQRGTYAEKIDSEMYRQWLVELVRPYRVLLCTVRYFKHRDQTLRRIADLTHWQPEAAFFNPSTDFRGFIIKDRYLREDIFPTYGAPDKQRYYGIESSPHTRAMYGRHGIPAMGVPETGIWTRLPFQPAPE